MDEPPGRPKGHPEAPPAPCCCAEGVLETIVSVIGPRLLALDEATEAGDREPAVERLGIDSWLCIRLIGALEARLGEGARVEEALLGAATLREAAIAIASAGGRQACCCPPEPAPAPPLMAPPPSPRKSSRRPLQHKLAALQLLFALATAALAWCTREEQQEGLQEGLEPSWLLPGQMRDVSYPRVGATLVLILPALSLWVFVLSASGGSPSSPPSLLAALAWIVLMHGTGALWCLCFIAASYPAAWGLARAARGCRSRRALKAVLYMWAAVACAVSLGGSGLEVMLDPDGWEGLAPWCFGQEHSFKYTAMRALSYGVSVIDNTLPESFGEGFLAYASFMTLPATFLCGPLVPLRAWQGGAGPSDRAGGASGNWAGALGRALRAAAALAPLAGIALATELALQYEDPPSLSRGLTFAPSLAHSFTVKPTSSPLEGARGGSKPVPRPRPAGLADVQVAPCSGLHMPAAELGIAARKAPWELWALGHGIMLFLWVQSHLAFSAGATAARAVGLACPDDTPEGYLSTSTSFTRQWSRFHVTFHRWLLQQVFIPAGGGLRGLAAAVAVSTALHGGGAPWLLWGGLVAGGLSAEKLLKLNFEWYARPGVVVVAANQSVCHAAMLLCIPGFTPENVAWFAVWNAPFVALNAVRLAAARAGPFEVPLGGHDKSA